MVRRGPPGCHGRRKPGRVLKETASVWRKPVRRGLGVPGVTQRLQEVGSVAVMRESAARSDSRLCSSSCEIEALIVTRGRVRSRCRDERPSDVPPDGRQLGPPLCDTVTAFTAF